MIHGPRTGDLTAIGDRVQVTMSANGSGMIEKIEEQKAGYNNPGWTQLLGQFEIYSESGIDCQSENQYERSISKTIFSAERRADKLIKV